MTGQLANKQTFDAEKLAELFKYFGDPHRLNILVILSKKETAVSQLAEQLETTVSAVSHQLKQLYAARLVTRRREGKNIYYKLLDDHVHQLIAIGVEHINEKE